MGQANAFRGARLGIEVEPQHLAVGQLHRAPRKRAYAKLRTLQVHQDADRPAGLRLDGSNRMHPLPVVGRRAVAEVEAEHVDAAAEERVDYRG
jgi:hypothetical protein